MKKDVCFSTLDRDQSALCQMTGVKSQLISAVSIRNVQDVTRPLLLPPLSTALCLCVRECVCVCVCMCVHTGDRMIFSVVLCAAVNSPGS